MAINCTTYPTAMTDASTVNVTGTSAANKTTTTAMTDSSTAYPTAMTDNSTLPVLGTSTIPGASTDASTANVVNIMAKMDVSTAGIMCA